MPLVLPVAGLIGLVTGSFLTAVVWRVPRGRPVATAACCPHCGGRVRLRDGLPVLSWLMLGGRCRDCRQPVSVRYPLMEAGTGVLFWWVAWWVMSRDLLWLLPAAGYLAAMAVALIVIDLEVHRLPDAIVLRSYPVLLGLLALASWGETQWDALARAVAASVVLVLSYALMWVTYPAGLGLGDVKLAGVIGLALGWIGWGAVLIGCVAAFLLAGTCALVLLAAGRAGPRSAIAFGPWMWGGAVVGMVAGPGLCELYLGAWG